MNALRRRLARAVGIITMTAGVALLARGLLVPAKARLADVLLRAAWERARDGEPHARPWPWADTWPVARLVIPGRDVDLIVLEGANGRAMAFAPGHAFGTAPPGTRGNSVIAGHRDTHLAFLRDVVRGDSMIVLRPDGTRVAYVVDGASRVRETETDVMLPSDATRLTLITCWPFDALRAGGPWRWVVTASAQAVPVREAARDVEMRSEERQPSPAAIGAGASMSLVTRMLHGHELIDPIDCLARDARRRPGHRRRGPGGISRPRRRACPLIRPAGSAGSCTSFARGRPECPGSPRCDESTLRSAATFGSTRRSLS